MDMNSHLEKLVKAEIDYTPPGVQELCHNCGNSATRAYLGTNEYICTVVAPLGTFPVQANATCAKHTPREEA